MVNTASKKSIQHRHRLHKKIIHIEVKTKRKGQRSRTKVMDMGHKLLLSYSISTLLLSARFSHTFPVIHHSNTHYIWLLTQHFLAQHFSFYHWRKPTLMYFLPYVYMCFLSFFLHNFPKILIIINYMKSIIKVHSINQSVCNH